MRHREAYLSTADAARLLGVTPAAVRGTARRGALPVATTTESGIRLFHRAEVAALARKRAMQKGGR
jgi:DNA-binding transcriptional MerR regulator